MGGCMSSEADGQRRSPAKPTPKQSAAPTVRDDFGLGERFQLIKEIGRGGTGDTWLCLDKQNDKQVAVKLFERPLPCKRACQMILDEVKIQSRLSEFHVNIVTVHELILTWSHLALVMEYVPGGPLTQYVMDHWQTAHNGNGLYLSEDETCYMLRQIVSVAIYLHANFVAHRDLKLDNTLLDDSSPKRIKIADFGYAKMFSGTDSTCKKDMSQLRTHLGTTPYMSPQVLESSASTTGYSGEGADVWAIGVLMCSMLLGMFPYDHDDEVDPVSSTAQQEVLRQQKIGNWRLSRRVQLVIGPLSKPCIDLLDKMLEYDQDKRISLQGITEHPFYNKTLPKHYQDALDEMEQAQKLNPIKPEPDKAWELQISQDLIEVLKKYQVKGLPSESRLTIGLKPHLTGMKETIEEVATPEEVLVSSENVLPTLEMESISEQLNEKRHSGEYPATEEHNAAAVS